MKTAGGALPAGGLPSSPTGLCSGVVRQTAGAVTSVSPAGTLPTRGRFYRRQEAVAPALYREFDRTCAFMHLLLPSRSRQKIRLVALFLERSAVGVHYEVQGPGYSDGKVTG